MIISPLDLLRPWNGKDVKPRCRIAGDLNYFCPNIEKIENEIYPNFHGWLKSMNLNKWNPRWDCDNFSMAFKVFADSYYFNNSSEVNGADGIGIGIIHYISESRTEDKTKGAHAINILYLAGEKNELGLYSLKHKFLEPQNGKIFDLTESEFKSIFFLYV